MDAPDVIVRYFQAQSARDFDTLVGLFTKDGLVVDEGKTWSGASGIRQWREQAASVYQYTTKLLGVESVDENEFAAKALLEGNFPGGRVELDYRFTLEGDRIRRLEID